MQQNYVIVNRIISRAIQQYVNTHLYHVRVYGDHSDENFVCKVANDIGKIIGEI